MKDVVNAIADSLETEVATPNGWTVQRFDPIWRNPEDGPMLYVYGTRMVPGDFRTTGTREDIYEVVVSYMEATGTSDALTRDETAELDFADKVTSLREWADEHQTLTGIHRLDYVGISFAPDVRREAAVRYCEMTLHARRVATYA